MLPKLKRQDLIEPEISYKIMGVVFDVANALEYGYSEKYYQKALEVAFKDANLEFRREVLLPVVFHGKEIGRQRCDFLIANKVLLEIKKGAAFSKTHIDQTVNYLKAANLSLAILVNFTPRGVLYRRIINSDSYVRKYS